MELNITASYYTMLTSDKNKPVVFISGASGTIGRCLVDKFSSNGYEVIAGYFSCMMVKTDKNIFQLDVTNAESVRNVFGFIKEKYNRLDVLINAAGLADDELIINMTENSWDRVIDVNLKGVMNCSRNAIELMKNNGGGHIINFASISALNGRVGQGNYSAAKAAIIGFTMSLAKELGKMNIRVNVILPGIIPSKMTANLNEKMLNKIIKDNVLCRSTTAEEVARFCAFLATMKNISGQVFHLDSRITRWV